MWLSRRADESSRSSASTAGSISWASSTISTGRDRAASIWRLPAIAQHLGAGPPVVRGELDAEQIAHLAIEVGEAGLGPAEDADLDVALSAEPLGENAQGDRLAGAGRAGDEGEAALADELLDAPAERLDASADVAAPRPARRGRTGST